MKVSKCSQQLTWYSRGGIGRLRPHEVHSQLNMLLFLMIESYTCTTRGLHECVGERLKFTHVLFK